MKKYLMLVLLPVQLLAQDFTGTWTGWVVVGGIDMPYELVIFEGESGLEGYAMTSAIVNDAKNVGIKTVSFKVKKNKLELEDDELVFSDFSKPPKRNILAAELSLDGSGPTQELSGSYRTRSVDMRDRSAYTGKIFLKKVKEGEFNELTARLSDMRLFPLKERFVYSEVLIAKNADALSEKKKSGGYEKDLNSGAESGNKKTDGKESKNNSSVKNKTDKKDKENNVATAVIESTLAKNEMTEIAASKPVSKKIDSHKKDDRQEDQKANKGKAELASGAEEMNKRSSDKTKKELNLYNPTPAADLSSRKIEVIHNYFFSGDSLEITFYDNGTVDGDTISVLLNRDLIIAKKQLTTNPLTEKIAIPKNTDSLELIMYAENLGVYPPNTGILVIKDGKSRIDIRFAGDLSRSASIILRRKK